MTTTRLRIFAGLLVVAALLGGAPFASAQSTSTFIVNLDRTGNPGVDALGNPTGAFQNPCTLEFVDVTGTSTVKITQQAANQKGEVKTTVAVSSKGSGTGWIDPNNVWPGLPTGHTYVFSENQSFVTVGPVLAAGEVFRLTFHDKLTMKGAGNLDNWIVRVFFRLKIDSSGRIQVSIERATGDVCHG